MCGQSETIEGEWQKTEPNTPGEWLWIRQWDCGCVSSAGIAWVPEEDEWTAKDLVDIKGGHGFIPLSNGLCLSWEGPPQNIKYITAWRKINLPPQEWLEEKWK